MNRFADLLSPCLALSLALAAPAALAGPPEDEAVRWLQDFIRVDTTNPPGNESRAVEYLAAILDAEGIAWQSAESAPGRGNLWARLEGGDEPALILLQHTDVVPADRRFWTTDPLGGEIRDGYIWGRGAMDMKNTGISQLAAFVGLHRAGRKLNRDVVLLATADEEAGGLFGVGWMIEHHPEVFAGAGFLLNEGANGIDRGGQRLFGVEVTQKVPVWLRLTAVDTPGHGSMPAANSSVLRIVEALDRLRRNPFPPRIVPAVDTYFAETAQDEEGEWAAAFADIGAAVGQPGFLEKLQQKSAFLHGLTRDTCALTRMEGSNKINTVPPEAWAEIDCRMLPDRPAEVFVEEIRALLEGTGVEVEVLMAFTPAVSLTDSTLYGTIQRVMTERYPGARVLPSVVTGFTDSHFTRDLGIASYGFDPTVIPEADFTRYHGNDERIGLEAFRQGVGDYRAVIEAFVYD